MPYLIKPSNDAADNADRPLEITDNLQYARMAGYPLGQDVPLPGRVLMSELREGNRWPSAMAMTGTWLVAPEVGDWISKNEPIHEVAPILAVNRETGEEYGPYRLLMIRQSVNAYDVYETR